MSIKEWFKNGVILYSSTLELFGLEEAREAEKKFKAETFKRFEECKSEEGYRMAWNFALNQAVNDGYVKINEPYK